MSPLDNPIFVSPFMACTGCYAWLDWAAAPFWSLAPWFSCYCSAGKNGLCLKMHSWQNSSPQKWLTQQRLFITPTICKRYRYLPVLELSNVLLCATAITSWPLFLHLKLIIIDALSACENFVIDVEHDLYFLIDDNLHSLFRQLCIACWEISPLGLWAVLKILKLSVSYTNE